MREGGARRAARPGAMGGAAALLAAVIGAAGLGAACLLGCGARGPRSDAAEPDLVVYSAHPEEILRFVGAEWTARTGKRVEFVQAGTGELLARIAAEAAEGAPGADLLWGGGAESVAARAALFEPRPSSEDAAIPERYKAPDRLWTGFTLLPMVIAYNARLLGPERAPRGWADLLDPRLAGNIAFADPAVSGSAYTSLRTMRAALAPRGNALAPRGDALAPRGGGAAGRGGPGSGGPIDPVEALARALGGELLPESSRVLPSVASGEYLVGISFENQAAELAARGSDLRILYPAEGTSAVPDIVALVRGARRRGTAEGFMDFVLGADVAAVMAGRFGRRSARADAPEPRGLPALAAVRLLDYDIPASAAAKPAELEAFARAFASGGAAEGGPRPAGAAPAARAP